MICLQKLSFTMWWCLALMQGLFYYSMHWPVDIVFYYLLKQKEGSDFLFIYLFFALRLILLWGTW